MADIEASRQLSRDLTKAVRELMPEIINLRRHLHKHPELSGHEERTAAFIADILEKEGLPVRSNIGGHGLLAKVLARHTDGWIALRADMDALPIQDHKLISYRSSTANVCHACGHDAHTAMLVGAALVLSRFPTVSRRQYCLSCFSRRKKRQKVQLPCFVMVSSMIFSLAAFMPCTATPICQATVWAFGVV